MQQIYKTKTGIQILPHQLVGIQRDHTIGFHGIDTFIAAASFYQRQPKTPAPTLPSVDSYGNTHIDRDD